MESQNEIAQNEPKNEDKPISLPQKEKKSMTCMSITCWILQVLIWIGAISLLYIDIYKEKTIEYWYTSETKKYTTVEFILIITFESVLYLFYVIFQFFTPTFSYLIHKKSDVKLSEKLKKLFQTPPVIKFVCECYHYETRTYTVYDSKGNSSTRTQQVRVVTRIDSKLFNYYSSRDVSGLFTLNYDESSVTNKIYVKLELLGEYSFADAITYSDFQKERDEFYNKNLGYDTYMDFYVNNIIEGLTNYNLINITDSNPCGMSVFWYVFFTICGIVQLYKIYVNSKCVYKSFTIRKLISSRYSLTTEECDYKYKRVDPAISFEDQNINLPPNEIGYVSTDFEQNLPTQEELELAQQYNDKVYNINDFIGKENENKPQEDALKVEPKNYQSADINSGNNYEDNNLKTELISQ